MAGDSAFQPHALEASLYPFWEENGLFSPEAQPQPTEGRFSLVIPPPNVTGTLHMGHALDNTLQDILVRWHRMRGERTLWMPGTDHAGIATQNVVERQLRSEGLTKWDLGREAFLEKVWDWAHARKGDILGQFRRLGISPDWSRQRFTLDEGLTRAVREAFVRLYEDGLIYQGRYIVNWCPRCTSAISDIETDYEDEESHLWELAYPLASGEGRLVVATTRPETLFGDVAVAVHPEDERYQGWIGKTVRVPLSAREIPIIADPYVDREFGTGALKITPAHDPNDFKIGQAHGLAPLFALDERGQMLAEDHIPASLHGLDRFDARKQTEALLEAAGLLVSKTPHNHRVGHCQRCSTTIEPYLSKQWFVRTKPLAEKGLALLDPGPNGEEPALRFIPERWTHDYRRWLENIQDWCISRQLWWGHSIPAWTCGDCGEVTVARETPTVCRACQSPNLTQDPDVLDTWFSSGLWPFSTMGWPDESAPDFQTFYRPNGTDVLVTGFDIIFFWVARMVMFGVQFTGTSPFHTVYIHGLIRDEKGQKMSKSKGNTVDPVKVIDEMGCDAFRYGLTSLVTYGGQDIKLSKDKLEQGRLFANKLWNAARFVRMNLEGVDAQPIDPAQLSPMDRWLLESYQRAVEEAHTNLMAYRFADWANGLVTFTWDTFCDWYVEWAKRQLKAPETRANTQRVLVHVLDGVLRLLHPAMPFITEAIWQELPHRETRHPGLKSISIARYPAPDQPLVDTGTVAVLGEVNTVFDVIREVRSLRQQYGVPHPTPVPVCLAVFPDAAEAERSAALSEMQAVEAHQDILGYFVKLCGLTAYPDGIPEAETRQCAVATLGGLQIFVPLAGVIDLGQERQRLSQQLAKLTKEQNQLNGQLGNADFVKRAPVHVVDQQRDRLNEVNAQVASLQQQLLVLEI